MLAMLLITTLGCSGPQEGTNAEATPVADTVAEVPVPPAFQPFDAMEISHTVKDYPAWKKAFDLDSTTRIANGLDLMVVGKNMENANDLVIYLNAADVTKAKAFAADPRLKELMEKSGVSSEPEINYWHVLRFDREAKEGTWVTVTHRVKDFDAWLKVFDNEGTAARAAEGLYDVVLARGVDDPNLVFMVFDIKDLDQAKASIGSDAKKALMESAGVQGPPTIKYYNTAE